MKLTEEQKRTVNLAPCCFPAIAWKNLEAAQATQLPATFDERKRTTEQHEAIEYAAVAVMASAAAIESHVVLLAYFILGFIEKFLGRTQALGFARTFLKNVSDKPGKEPWTPGKRQRVVEALKLYKFGEALTSVLGTSPGWPSSTGHVRELRNHLLHNSVTPTQKAPVIAGGGDPAITLTLLSAEDPAALVGEAEQCVTTMFECLRCLGVAKNSIAGPHLTAAQNEESERKAARLIVANLYRLVQ